MRSAAVRLTQIDGKLPNLALMKLAHWHKSLGDDVVFTKHVERGLYEPEYKTVYGSAIFSYSADRVAVFKEQFPNAIVGGTWNLSNLSTVEQMIGQEEYEHYDYSIYAAFDASIGFTQRGCRLKCGFCVVPKKEGKPRSVNTIYEIWRGGTYPKHLHLLDNDFFGQPEDQWRARLNEILDGGFKVCLNQGINIRLITEAAARAIAQVPYYDDSFRARRLYTAWDNLKDEKIFMRGVERLDGAGVPPSHLLVYMLVGFDESETWERLFYRFNKMVSLGIRPYPMIFGSRAKTLPLGGMNAAIAGRTLGEFQRWVIRKAYRFVPFEEYDVNARGRLTIGQGNLFEVAA
ncbi:hypothetical protein SAMN04515648_4533 [Phyllobacterium sp. CL33Tsu]|uniref:radical SAM protein n=1 Tax=Phyllobacterium sp. CL33Tsu TaxID=1798191 RepID=UPI0008DEB312|nr:radical SAM protein [Phyllobacterium sp. CL33Tsu]SFJ54679.1 hypothetical protein SAMN04515648_4533 [Phyllobacterium sp. CL33Tsu]